MFSQAKMDSFFSHASADEVLCLMEELRKEEPGERSIVDETGTRNLISYFRSQTIGKATHDNLLDVVEVPAHF